MNKTKENRQQQDTTRERTTPKRIPAKYQDSLECDSLYPALELKAVLLNINPGHNQELLDSCKTLRDYSE